jgi:triacylglycerol lipase
MSVFTKIMAASHYLINYAILPIGILLICVAGAAAETTVPETPPDSPSMYVENQREETIVLLSGIGRGRASLWVLDTRFQQAGYKTLNYPYVAQGYSIEELAQQFCLFLEENVKTKKYSLVAHSLGNLIIRLGFEQGYPEGLGRIVMLAPPNRPTELARALRDNPIYKWFTSGQFASDEFYARLPIPDVEFGVIAGDRGQAVMLQEPNDGVITVESTKLSGMADWIVVPHAHTFIMNSRLVAELCISFIEEGKFTDIPIKQEGTDEKSDSENSNENPGE